MDKPPVSTDVTGEQTVLLTLGRLPVALEIARAFKASGWRVIVAEPFAWHLCRLSRSVAKSFRVCSPVSDKPAYQRQLLEIVQRESVSLVVPVSEEILFVSELRDRLPDNVVLLAMHHDVLMKLHDKWLFHDLASRLSLSVPDAALADDAEAQTLMSAGDYVIKPRLSCSGVGISFGTIGSTLPVELHSSRNLVQTRLSEPGCSSFAIALNGQCLKLVTYRSLLESGSVSVCFESVEVSQTIDHFVRQIIRAVQFTGMISFDFLQDMAGRWMAIECNPRATSGIHFLDSAELADALLCAAGLAKVREDMSPTPHRVCVRRQEFWSSLTEVEGKLFKGKLDKVGWTRLFTTRDINWAESDRKPSLLMPFASAQLLWKAFRQGSPVSQVAMQDLGWYVPSTMPHESASFRIETGTRIPQGANELLASTVFGTDGLRYRRFGSEASLNRFHQPVFISAFVKTDTDTDTDADTHRDEASMLNTDGTKLVGLYVLDQRQLRIDGHRVSGIYRGALAVDANWQGRGVAKAMSEAGVQWTQQHSLAIGAPVLSYGCIDASNSRSMNLLTQHHARSIGTVSLFMMYRQWPRSRCTLEALDEARLAEYVQLVAETRSDCCVLDVTPSQDPAYLLADESGIRIGARVSESTFSIVDMGRLLTTITRLFVSPWPPARKRFDPARFQHLVFTHIAIREGCEKDWPDFVSSVMARHGVHFAITYPDTQSELFESMRTAGMISRLVHSRNGTINVMARVYGDHGGLAESLQKIHAHALFPVDA